MYILKLLPRSIDCNLTSLYSFIKSQLQLEADAREALPYVRPVLQHHGIPANHYIEIR